MLIKEGTHSRGLFFIMRGAVELLGSKPVLTDSQLARIRIKFDAFDVDRSGAIDANELHMAMRSLNLEVSKREVRAQLLDIDADGSGEVEFSEFLDVLLMNNAFRVGLGLDPQISETLSEGFFGEESVLTSRPSTMTVRSAKYSDFFLLPTGVFNRVLAQNSAMKQLVTDYARRRAEMMEEKQRSVKKGSRWKKVACATRVANSFKV